MRFWILDWSAATSAGLTRCSPALAAVHPEDRDRSEASGQD